MTIEPIIDGINTAICTYKVVDNNSTLFVGTWMDCKVWIDNYNTRNTKTYTSYDRPKTTR
jgi:hypothetical protein